VSVIETTTDGVLTLFVEQEGPTSAGLVFRVGEADESLAVRGLTHLVQHLALQDAVGSAQVHEHGSTNLVHTEFHATGTPAEVVRVLNAVCEALRDPPARLLEVARTSLRDEGVGHDASRGRPAVLRHGAQAHGLVGFPELGLAGLGPVDVTTWTTAAFTRGNAVFWCVGPGIPSDLDLELPDGPAADPPPTTTILASTPASVLEPGSGTLRMTGLLGRSLATDLFARVLEEALAAELMGEEPLAADIAVDTQPHDGDVAAVTVTARALPGVGGALHGGVVDTLARLCWGAITPEEVDAARAPLLEDLAEPGWDARTLPARALDSLLGAPTPNRGELRYQLEMLGPDDLREAADELFASALAEVPEPGLEWAGFTAVREHASPPVQGVEVLPRDGSDEVLVLGDDGVTLHRGFGVSTVRFSDVAVMQAYADGGRWIVGRDGTRIDVEPGRFPIGEEALAGIDDAVDPVRVVRLPARRRETVPGAVDLLVEPKTERVPAAVADGAAPPRRSLGGLFRRKGSEES
jgi:zinc protease